MRHPRIPSATYRLQFHAGFTFQEAIDILDYLQDLGITDVYSSPFFQAAPDSTHGYDVADHNRLNPALGGEAIFDQFITELKKRGMGQVLDFVPNHMGISESINEWWMEVLEDGVASQYATYFDIDWHSGKEALEQKLLLPILGDRYGKVLEEGELRLGYDSGCFSLNYFAARIPIDPGSYPLILEILKTHLADARPEIDLLAARFSELKGLLDQASRLEIKSEALAHLNSFLERPESRAALEATLLSLNGANGDARSFDSLHSLLEKQNYRLSYWRVAAEEINYRRFFDINTLAAIRVEVPEVFEASHQYVFKLLEQGAVTGLRIDHVDGLWDPREYFQRLQKRGGEIFGEPNESTPLYLVVEKILEPTQEQIPADWPVHGTTGYEVTNHLVHLLVDSSSEKHLTKTYQAFTGSTDRFEDLVYEKKTLIAELSFHSEVTALGRLLDEISEFHRHFRDFPVSRWTSAVRELLACFPVYRTYATPEGMLSKEDERNILKAVSLARRRNPTIEKPIFDFLRNLLLLRFPEDLSPAEKQRHLSFVMKFQQCSGPLMAKGFEDTALYLYNRLIALNEVGGNPGKVGIEVSEFHRLNQERLARSPHSLIATSTHDTKRSEDVRMRLAAISEVPGKWRKAVNRWSRINRKFRIKIGEEFAPSANEEYLLYQTLLGVWPFEPLTVGGRKSLIERVNQYLLKALKEGKVNSSWTEPNEEWEKAVSQFVEKILDEKSGAKFQQELQPFAEEISRLGALNSLAEIILKCTIPGVPDFYQGSEIWDFSLVDPDNRRKVDYPERIALVTSIAAQSFPDLLKEWKTGGIKLRVIQELLKFRNVHAELFRNGDYHPVEVKGTYARNVIAFLRVMGREKLLVVVPRLLSAFAVIPVGGDWKDTRINLTESGDWISIFSETATIRSNGDVELKTILRDLPFAVLFSKS